MEKIKEIWKKYNLLYLLLPLLFYAYQGILYLIIPLINSNGHEIPIWLDNKIPVIKFFVIFYYIYYVLPIILIWYVSFKDKQRSKILICSCFISATICYIFFCFYQVHMVRPEIVGNDIFSILIRFMYNTSDPKALNCCPSIHTIMGIFTIISLLKVKNISILKKIGAVVCGAGIILSTLFIKQHYVIDVLAGIGLSLIVYFIVYLIFKFNLKKQV